jgi:hypothetical protein
VVFNFNLIAFMLMEMNVFQALEQINWAVLQHRHRLDMMAVVADLVINKSR